MVDQDRNGDRHIYFDGRYEYSSVDGKKRVRLVTGKMAIWNGTWQ